MVNTEFETQSLPSSARDIFNQVELCGLFEDEMVRTPHTQRSFADTVQPCKDFMLSDEAEARLNFFIGYEDLADCVELFAIWERAESCEP